MAYGTVDARPPFAVLLSNKIGQAVGTGTRQNGAGLTCGRRHDPRLAVARETPSHGELAYRLNVLHRFHRTMAILTTDCHAYVALMAKANVIRQVVHLHPADRLLLTPRLLQLWHLTCRPFEALMATKAGLNAGNAGHFGPVRLTMAVEATDLIAAGVQSMTKCNGLLDHAGELRPGDWQKGHSYCHGACHECDENDGAYSHGAVFSLADAIEPVGGPWFDLQKVHLGHQGILRLTHPKYGARVTDRNLISTAD